MSNLKVLSWLEFLNTVQGCFQIPQYSPFCERVFEIIKGHLLYMLSYIIHLCKRVVDRGNILMSKCGFTLASRYH